MAQILRLRYYWVWGTFAVKFNGGYLKFRSFGFLFLGILCLLSSGGNARSAPPTGPAPVRDAADGMFSTPDCQLPPPIDPNSLPSARQKSATAANASTSTASIALSSVLEAGARLTGSTLPPSLMTGMDQSMVGIDAQCPSAGEDVEKLLSGVKFEGEVCPAPSQIDALKAGLSNFVKAQACDIARMQAGKQEIQMLNREVSELQKVVGRYQQCFQNSLSQVQNQVSEIDDDIKDREAQLKNIA